MHGLSIISETIVGQHAIQALHSGAHGYIAANQPISDIKSAIRSVIDGHISIPFEVADQVARNDVKLDQASPVSITARQQAVLQLLAQGSFQPVDRPISSACR